MKIEIKVLIVLLSVILIIGALVVIVSVTLSKNVVEQQIYNHLETTAQSRANHIEAFLELKRKTVNQLSQSIVIQELLLTDKNDKDYATKFHNVTQRLKNRVESEEFTYGVFVLDKNGIIIASSEEMDIGKDKSADPYFLGGKQGVFVKNAYFSQDRKLNSLAFSAPIFDDNNEFLSVVVMRSSMEGLDKITTDRTGLGETGEIYLMNNEGYMITPSRFIKDTFLKQKVDTENGQKCLECLKNIEERGHKPEAVVSKNYLGRDVLGTHSHNYEMGWCLLAEMSEKEAFAPVTKLTYMMILILAVILAMCIILSILLSAAITRPIVKLHQGAEEIIKGNLDFKVGTKSGDEIGQLSRAFDSMAVSLKKSRKELQEHSKGLEKIVEARTAELKEQFQNSEQQRIATLNALQDLDETNEKLMLEIEERKHAEENLKETTGLLQSIMDSATEEIIMATDPIGTILSWNEGARRLLGYEPEEVVGKESIRIFHTEEYLKTGRMDPNIKNMIATRKSLAEELTYVDKDGKTFPVHQIVNPRFDENGEFIGMLGSARDITERKLNEEELRASEARFKFLAENTMDIIYRRRFNPDEYDYVSPSVNKIIGYSPEEFTVEILNNIILEQKHLSHPDIPEPELIEEMECGKISSFEVNYKIRAKNGDIKWLGDRATVWRDSDNNFIGTVGVLRDITEEVRAKQELIKHAQLESALKEASQQLLHESTIEDVSASILSGCLELTGSAFGLVGLIDSTTGTIAARTNIQEIGDESQVEDETSVSKEFSDLWNWVVDNKKSILYNDSSSEVVKSEIPEGHLPISRFLSAPSIYHDELLGIVALANAEHDYTDHDLTAVEQFSDLYALAVHREREQEQRQSLQTQLNQAQKMEAVGTLAGGIAHDFNNLLTGIIGGAQVVLMKLPSDSPERDRLQQIEESGLRAADLTSQLLTISQRQAPVIKPTNINQVVAKVARLLQHSIPETIEIKVSTDAMVPVIAADEGQLRQVLLNLGINARDAMPKGGKLTLKTWLANRSDLEMPANVREMVDGYVCVSVTDTGVGMDEETQQRIFEPFFTTKAEGEGTGLGLAMVYGIIKNHHGWINVSSTLGQGTTFSFYLPALEVEPEETVETFEVVVPLGTETVLLVDNNETILYVGGGMIERCGYTVLKAESGKEALQVYEQHKSQIRLVIADWLMPIIDGYELLSKLRQQGSEVPVILISGYNINKSEEEIIQEGFAGLIKKPLRVEEVATKIRSVLDV